MSTVDQSPSSSSETNQVLPFSETSVEEGKEEAETLSKNKFRKQRNYEKTLLNRQLKRQKERELRKEKKLNNSLHNDEKLAIIKRLKDALDVAPKIVIDCQFDNRMSQKEQNRLAAQLRRAYASNKACLNPVHLILCSLSENSEFFKLCCNKNEGFANYALDRREESVKDCLSCPSDQIVYLSPDSPNVLSELDPLKVYVIGGLVDETTNTNISLTFSNQNNFATAKLPIDEYFVAEKGSGTFKKVLTINQVFDILLEWYKTKDWIKAISVGLPERTGFVPRITLSS
jgi:tRNA (guanine9-N1)-methyltransferase